LTKKMSEPEKPATAGFSASQKPHFYFSQTVDVKTASNRFERCPQTLMPRAFPGTYLPTK